MNECEICGHVLGSHAGGRAGGVKPICTECGGGLAALHEYRFGSRSRLRHRIPVPFDDGSGKPDVLALALAVVGGLIGSAVVYYVLVALAVYPYVGRVPAPWEW